MSRRIERINNLIRQEISDLLLREIKDPRLDSFLSIVRVDTAADLSYARVYVSFLGADDQRRDTMAA
jgi:ribosome-binding factor A